MESISEIWRPVAGEFSGWRYEVSNRGRVRSVATERLEKTKWGTPTMRRRTSQLIAIHHDKYSVCRLSDPSRRCKKTALVHRLVAQAFLENPQGLPQVNHKDFDTTNNNSSNLEWVTLKQNVDHRHINGRYAVGEQSASAKLTDSQALEAYEMRKQGRLLQDIGRVFGVHYTTIQLIVTGKHFQHLGLLPLPVTPRKRKLIHAVDDEA